MTTKHTALITITILTLLAIPAFASELSLSLKRTNPGIVGVTPAELIFDIVNTDTEHQINGFILCKSPDDATISSTLGLAAGSGAQYVSPRFDLDLGPSQKAAYLTIESNTEGDHRANCILKYLPYREVNGTKTYLKLNLEETTTPRDQDYREIRLDKNVPFIKLERDTNAYCPGRECTLSELIIVTNKTKSTLNFTLILLIAATILLAIVVKNAFKNKRS
ncbi:hypothetical protein C4580_02010 [Candidatus Woesearchaeota archaeon]|nr:MAG: hypothetical protein C4580_02010 [Candidatus Woesearchaeota archaeon]